jgi:hypothetical protein
MEKQCFLPEKKLFSAVENTIFTMRKHRFPALENAFF